MIDTPIRATQEMDGVELATAYWLLGRAEHALGIIRDAERCRPHDTDLAALRIDILRSQGQRAEWEALGRDTHPPPARRFRAAPYVIVSGFLEGPALGRLRAVVAANRAAFATSAVGAGTVDEDHRRSLRLRDPAVEQLVRDCFVPRLMPVLRRSVEGLLAGSGSLGRVECTMTACLPGGFFKAHRDDVAHEEPGTSNHERVVSYVCWIHREPARFTGGELMLHDATDEGYGTVAGTRFPPTAGTLVVFPSSAYHSVLPVCGDGVDLFDARLAITGHVRARSHDVPTS